MGATGMHIFCLIVSVLAALWFGFLGVMNSITPTDGPMDKAQKFCNITNIILVFLNGMSIGVHLFALVKGI